MTATQLSKPRRRRTTTAQRLAANERERRRMANIGIAFRILQAHIPTFVYERSLTRIETLKMAIEYIRFMHYELLMLPIDTRHARQQLYDMN